MSGEALNDAQARARPADAAHAAGPPAAPVAGNVVLDEMAWDRADGRLDYLGIRYLLIRPETLAAVYDQVAALDGESCREAFFQAGYRGVSLSMRQYREAGTMPEPLGMVAYMADMAAQLGWGRVVSAEVDEAGRALTIEVAESVFAHRVSGQALPVCDMFRGAFAAIGETVFGVSVVAVESACRAQGGASCRFVVTATAESPTAEGAATADPTVRAAQSTPKERAT